MTLLTPEERARLDAKLKEEGYEARDYGWRKKVVNANGNNIYNNNNSNNGRNGSRLYVIIDSGKHTGMGADPKVLNELGLRAHPDESYEQVEVIGCLSLDARGNVYVDTVDGWRFEETVERNARHSCGIWYKFLDHDRVLRGEMKKAGTHFYSVKTDSSGTKRGDLHVLINKSDAPVKLLIEIEKE